MNEEQLFGQMKMWRKWTVDFLSTIPEEMADLIPAGHRNSIRWNAGHILVGWDHTMFPSVGEERKLPQSYHMMFPRGSKPEDWDGDPPSMVTLISLLEEQVTLVERACSGRLNDRLQEPFLHMSTVGEMLLFHMNHENMHMGTIKSMMQMLK
ncbi:DinB family protein [Falsibacillus pallidus]|uniref:DinB family protein n=1 Tax=Falsibacillus pallidus TaxID=493781 RepID=UPI003D957EB2